MSREVKISYRALCEELLKKDADVGSLTQALFPELQEDDVSEIVHQVSRRFVPNFKRRLKDASFNKSRFLGQNKEWLDGEFVGVIEEACHSGEVNKGGRPIKSFKECSTKAQKYKVQSLRESNSQELIDAAASNPPCKCQSTGSFDAESALALIVQTKLTVYNYETIRRACKNIGFDIFPSYKKILEAKQKCYPTNVAVTETAVTVNLQNMLDHTTERILNTVENTPVGLETFKDQTLILHTKWGCDGASGQSEFMQSFSSSDSDTSDSHLFMTSIVPLKITLSEDESREIWKNDRPSSTRYCRPLKFQFKKETPALILEEKQRVEEEIRSLQETVVHFGEYAISVSHRLYFTMIDGKVAQIVTNSSSSSNCIVCKAKPSQMNNLDLIRNLPLNEEALHLGISPLHARIRFMEYILHLSYNMDFKKWRASQDVRAIKEETKKSIQKDFAEKMGIKVDVVKQGAGTTNDGNVSRRFFGNPSLTAEITKVNQELITRMATILEVINTNHAIDAEKFGKYAEDTANLATSLYPWYNLPSSVHKVLMHGKEIIEYAALPVGTLSEEAQESRNKDYKYYRIHHSRKFSRISTNNDVFHMMMMTSDPLISRLRPEPKKKVLPLSEEALQLIK